MKESVRKCSHCGHNGHNSRTCNGGKSCMKLFGVTINVAEKEDEFIRKSKSTGDLVACTGEHSTGVDAGYLSDGLIQSRRAREAQDRKKGVPWTEDEHRLFLAGLEKIGKGNWRGISKNYVPWRTPTQVASHAQKYFIRLAATDKKKRRSSLFDMSIKEPEIHQSPPQEPPDKTAEVSQQAVNSPSVNFNNIGDTQGQTNTSTKTASPIEAPPVLPLPASYCVPDFRQLPYMPMNFAGAKVYPSVSYVPVMNYPNQGYFYLPKSYGSFATCAPYISQPPSGGFFPQPLPPGSSQASSATSITKQDGLGLRIGAI